jgi:CheY-like chemotaxis protein
VILLDIEMPTLNGFEACQQLKKSDETCEIPVIMLTAHTEPVTANTLLDQGVVEFIPKGAFSEAVLIETLRQLHILNKVEA